ncbi:peptidase [Deltaproteobacteria bacterium]|nr:peptidase [Deltaproteobacteria bacterium]
MLDFLLERIPNVVVLWLSLSVHEWAHARAAFALGDDTARAQGRMTLDPLAHADPVGTVLFPLLGVPFGWALPVPIDPSRFDRRRSMAFGMMVTAAAGPLSNVVLAGAGFTAWLALSVVFPSFEQGPLGGLARYAIQLNVLLAVFNLLPIPPLDGSRIVNFVLPRAAQMAWGQLESFGRFLPFVVIVGLRVVGLDPFGPILAAMDGWLNAAKLALGG